ncbi:MAG: FtsW/RodA/SpoVE family cell cycle protein [Lachnospiraceae bacterium]|nr:FtsW/RodA/SpoVE family cell cycle protein [Lachnospiraceae bacterium]MBR5916529.1 FtsW/RodA/SpoVE family cell cycle protein [Lachnospiraceae bacterium]
MRENVKEKKNTEKERLLSAKEIDISIIFIAIFLSVFCLVFVYSALAFEEGASKTILNILTLKSSDRTLLKTGFYVVAGIIGMMVFASINVNVLKKKAAPIMKLLSNPIPYYLISCGMFLFIFIMKNVGSDVGGESEKTAIVGAGWLLKANGAYRWIRIPGLNISFQPSEIAKFLLIICFALMIYNAGMSLAHVRGMAVYLFWASLPAIGILFFSSDMSSALVTFGILFVMMFVAGPNIKKTSIVLLAFVLVILLVFGVLIVKNHGKEESDIHPYQAKRLLAWLYPDEYPASADQTNQALYAIGSGGYLGEGIGNSMQKIKKLPEAQNDMIFALICEELGFAGGMIVIVLYLVLIFRMYMIAQNTDNLFERMVVVGVIAHVGLQVIINICVVTRLFPNTGIPLPLISSGGSSILFMYLELGLVLNIGKSIVRK